VERHVRENSASIKEALKKSGYSEKTIREILAWYLPSKKKAS
jgi:predicted Ser/Thr protein kinase